jgi:hypothetical protein
VDEEKEGNREERAGEIGGEGGVGRESQEEKKELR